MIKLNQVPFPRVTVFWLDIQGGGTWRPAATPEMPAECVTRGWLISKTKNYIHIASSLSRNDDGSWDKADTNDIPRGAVQEVRLEGRRRKRAASRADQTKPAKEAPTEPESARTPAPRTK